MAMEIRDRLGRRQPKGPWDTFKGGLLRRTDLLKVLPFRCLLGYLLVWGSLHRFLGVEVERRGWGHLGWGHHGWGPRGILRVE